ncbi:MAG: hypothetical protein ACYS76_02000 [Planctomycetota bacterium]|jgi:hypothetical protein
MKDDKENIDLLLEQNTAEQLAEVDWQALNASLSARLDQLNPTKTVAIKPTAALKVAGGLAAVAAIIFVVVFMATDRPPDLQLGNGQRAAVKFAEPPGTASVEIASTLTESEVFVEVAPAPYTLANCDVEIVDVDDKREKDGYPAAWIIISRPEPLFADNGKSDDLMDIICMF